MVCAWAGWGAAILNARIASVEKRSGCFENKVMDISSSLDKPMPGLSGEPSGNFLCAGGLLYPLPKTNCAVFDLWSARRGDFFDKNSAPCLQFRRTVLKVVAGIVFACAKKEK
jgi:hypothetical protein